MASKPKVDIKIDSKKIVRIVNELAKLGEPRWVTSRYKAATKKALQPALKQVISNAPHNTGKLMASMTINARNSKGKRGRTDARVGINARKFFVEDGKLVRRQNLINAIEFSKRGHPGEGFIRKAMRAEAKPSDIQPRVEEFLEKAVAKRTAFKLRKARKGKK